MKSRGMSALEAALLLAVMSPLMLGLFYWLEVLRSQSMFRFETFRVLREASLNSRMTAGNSLERLMMKLEGALLPRTNRLEAMEIYLVRVEFVRQIRGVTIVGTEVVSCSAVFCSSSHEGRRGALARVEKYARDRVEDGGMRVLDPESGRYTRGDAIEVALGALSKGRMEPLFSLVKSSEFEYFGVVTLATGSLRDVG